jgi:hypothetical protein
MVIYIATTLIHMVNKFGIITTFAVKGTTLSGNGVAGLAVGTKIGGNPGITTDNAGNVYLSDGNEIRKIDSKESLTAMQEMVSYK